MGSLAEMLADGTLSEDEREVLNHEAKRLHLSKEEVQRLIVQAKRERELKEDVSTLPLHKIAANPEHAVEHFKLVLSQMRQLAIMTDKDKFEVAAQRKDRLTAEEIDLWRRIHGEVPQPPQV